MIHTEQYGDDELAWYFAARLVFALVYLEGGYAVRVGINARTVDSPVPHNFCKCGGMRGEVTEIISHLLPALAAARAFDRPLCLSEHVDYAKAVDASREMARGLGMLGISPADLMESAESRIPRVLEDSWPAIRDLAAAIQEFGKLDGQEIRTIVRTALKGQSIDHCSMTWLVD